MNLVPWFRKEDDLVRMRNDFDSLVESFFAPLREYTGGESFLKPRVDITEDEKNIHVRADIPGVDPKNIKLELNDGVLTIEAERKEARKENKENYYYSERVNGKFLRSFTLPVDINEKNIDAEFKDGVLTITAEKIQPTKSKRINIKVKH